MNLQKIFINSFLPIFAGALLTAGIIYAWSEPTVAPPGNNVAAPINTGPDKQVKEGDICTTVTSEEICLSSVVSYSKCSLAGGTAVMIDGITLCRFPSYYCPIGWTQVENYTETAASTCSGIGNCGTTSVTSGSHPFANIDPATEAKTYYDGNMETYACGCGNNCCTGMCSGPYGWIVCCGYYYCCTSTCTGCVTTPRTCAPSITHVGCISITN